MRPAFLLLYIDLFGLAFLLLLQYFYPLTCLLNVVSFLGMSNNPTPFFLSNLWWVVPTGGKKKQKKTAHTLYSNNPINRPSINIGTT